VGVFPGTNYLRDIDEMETVGLYVKLGPWGFHFFEVHSPAAVQSTPSTAQETS
jgi:hypothetical protein